jgi:hypothetical protein
MLLLNELKDDKPILGEIRWKRKWGESMQIPGIGVRFENMDSEQLEEIRETSYLP